MKRTRRIEVVRYTRRVVVTERGSAPADAGEPPAIDITPAAPEGEDKRPDAGEAVEPQALRQRLASRLRDLLRPPR